jgi:hypothetical protein
MPLDFSSTQALRNDLLRRNLSKPYGNANAVLPINFTATNYSAPNGQVSPVIESEKIADRRVEDLLTAEFKNAYTPIFPYVYQTLPNISIVLNRRGIYPLFTKTYKYDETIGRDLKESTAYDTTGDVTGGFTWRSTSIKNDVKPRDESSFNASLSTNYDFRDDSILNMTQKILNATPKGAAGRSHVGNAIDQTSRVFKEGNKMISRGSAIKYVNKFNGSEGGAEYARVWTKDRPYTHFVDTMKKKGNIRKFTESVMDSPFNLNIAPQNGSTNFEGSSNISKSGDGFYAKKYMLSIENLAWKSSSRYGFRYEDLPFSERGPNGGRVMWFPPYDVKFNEGGASKWNDNTFLGRIEPIYTYQGAERTGNLSFKIVVDHPSILNLLVRKRFQNMSDEESNNYIMAFFTGAEDVDLYELARKYATLERDDLERILAYLNGNKPTKEIYKTYRTVVPTITETTVVSSGGHTDSPNKPTILFKDNSDVVFQESDESTYTAAFQSAAVSAGLTTGETQTYLSEITSAYVEQSWALSSLDKLIIDIKQNLKDGNSATVNIHVGKASHEGSVTSSRIEGMKRFILDKLGIAYEAKDVFDVDFFDGNTTAKTQLYFKTKDLGDGFTNRFGEVCNSPSIVTKAKNNTGLLQTISNNFYCRSTKIYASFTKRNMLAKKVSETTTGLPQTIEDTFTIERPAVPALDEAKRILMKLLSEQYYFDTLREDTPHVFSSLKEKLKYFHPAFHSTTPEGLNSRLTFLHQCTRPGDTMPIVQADGERTLTDARNTSFGAPPVCVLRVGDFFHSKIIVRDIQITYDDGLWDMNPEGIGLQPMVANINMSITFIGGQGLKGPVGELQNALSSNFYANTEMYDYRATATENREDFNKEFLQQLIDSSDSVQKADITYPKQSSYGDPIGKFITKDINSSGQTFGVLEYTPLINDGINALNAYGKSASDFYNSIYKKWGKTLVSMVFAESNRKYYTGNFVGTTLKIIGKHSGMGTEPERLVTTLGENIRDLSFDVFVKMKNQLSTSQYDLFKTNFETAFQETFKVELLDAMRTDINNGEDGNLKQQKTLVSLFDKINLINSKIDGIVTQEKTSEFTLSAATTNIMVEYFSHHLSSFNTLYSSMQSKLDNQTLATLVEDTTWRVNIMTTYFTETRINEFMSLFEGVGDSKLKKLREMFKNYLKAKEDSVAAPKSIINLNKNVEFSFVENLSAPNKATLEKIFTSSNVSTGGTYNYSNLI